ncbi:MAG: hypothetical protein HKO59_06205 [Phycisphaerales bacterium]|nr:hypothetical protein [Phycisphaerae bacterium]NNF43026.1 hypothetical protein [Phycisphaerales bacterium]NNM25566.1 hypothetical protein [Phycisphaerales bacterium]
MTSRILRRLTAAFALSVLALTPPVRAGGDLYTMVNIGKPDGADSVIGVRMNNHGHIAGYSIFYGAEPSIRGWVWRPESGFEMLPSPPDMFLGRFRAMDISDSGIVAGDGGFDAGIAWRLEDGVYETFGQIDGMPIAYLGGVNEAGDVVGTSKDASITTPDRAFIDGDDGGTIAISTAHSRATDVNDVGQVCGYASGETAFGAYRWDRAGGLQFLGTAGLSYSFANGINDHGDVVGSARSTSGHTTAAWIYSDELGQQIIPAPAGRKGAVAINNLGEVVGNTEPGSGPSFGWLWTPLAGTRTIFEVFDYVTVGLSGVVARDINDEGQILAYGYDNTAGEFRTILLTPVDTATGACCLDAGGCTADVTEDDCATMAGLYLGGGTTCASCTPVGSCCLTDGDCIEFQTEDDCLAVAGLFQGDATSCATAGCEPFLPNDDCADAIPIILGNTPFSTLGATTDGPALPASCMEPAGTFFGMDVWFRYVPDGTGTLTVSTCDQADYDTRLAAYVGSCDQAEIVACVDDTFDPFCFGGTSIMDVPVTCGEPVLLRVGSFSVYTGTGTLTLTFEGDGCKLPGDVDGDGIVGFLDLLAVLSAWGPCAACPADLNGDGVVDFVDLLSVLAGWSG